MTDGQSETEKTRRAGARNYLGEIQTSGRSHLQMEIWVGWQGGKLLIRWNTLCQCFPPISLSIEFLFSPSTVNSI